jgi:mannose-6-phosphate isomerase-like protein (cupin superfamily)
MRLLKISDLNKNAKKHFLEGLVPGDFLSQGGFSFKAPGFVTHRDEESHTHNDAEIFIILQGKGFMEVDGKKHNVATGDVIIIDAGESHYLHSSHEDPLANLWMHCGDKRNEKQEKQ